MDILIPDNWLREYLQTKATPKTIMDKLSLCGPSVEKINGKGKDAVYSIEVTTNRIDTACVYGIARESAAILTRFGIEANLKPLCPNKKLRKGQIDIRIDPDLKHVNRIMAVILTGIKNKNTPTIIRKRLQLSGLRSKNPAVDITNYIMLETGHPTHVFDYDKIKKGGLNFRLSKKGETAISLEGKNCELLGDDLVIVNNKDEIVDIPGIIGTKSSVVDESTNNILFFIDNNDPNLIRKTSMELGIRTNAASLNEKGVDPELAETAMIRGISLFKKLCRPKKISAVYDWYPHPYESKIVKLNDEFINQKIGVKISKKNINQFLKPLGFKTDWKEDELIVEIPSFRAEDIQIAEDIVEEIARMHGYFDLPGKLPKTIASNFQQDPILDLEEKIKNILLQLNGHEVYTLSMVSKKQVDKGALKLKNALGTESEFLRQSLAPSLIDAAKTNIAEDNFLIFEIANAYMPQGNNLPKEEPKLGLIFKGYNYRHAKGVLETLLEKLNISYSWKQFDMQYHLRSTGLTVKSHGIILGNLGKVSDKLIFAQFDVKNLSKTANEFSKYQPQPKFPPQIEDYTFRLKPGSRMGETITKIKDLDKNITKVKLLDMYEQKYTLRVHYQHPQKTLTKKEVEKIRNKIIKSLGSLMVE